MQTDPSAVGDMNSVVVKRVREFWQAGISGGSVDVRGTLHAQGLMRPLVVELLTEIIKFAVGSKFRSHKSLDARSLSGSILPGRRLGCMDPEGFVSL